MGGSKEMTSISPVPGTTKVGQADPVISSDVAQLFNATISPKIDITPMNDGMQNDQNDSYQF
jgi:hypothetical protein